MWTGTPKIVSLRVTRGKYGEVVSLERDDRVCVHRDMARSEVRGATMKMVQTAKGKGMRDIASRPPWVHPIRSQGTQTVTTNCVLDDDERQPIVIKMIQPRWGNDSGKRGKEGEKGESLLRPPFAPETMPPSPHKLNTPDACGTNEVHPTGGKLRSDEVIHRMLFDVSPPITKHQSPVTPMVLMRSNGSCVRWHNSPPEVSSLRALTPLSSPTVEQEQDQNEWSRQGSLLHNVQQLNELLGFGAPLTDENTLLSSASFSQHRLSSSHHVDVEMAVHSGQTEEDKRSTLQSWDIISNHQNSLNVSVKEGDVTSMGETAKSPATDRLIRGLEKEKTNDEVESGLSDAKPTEEGVAATFSDDRERAGRQVEGAATTAIMELMRSELEYCHAAIEEQQQQFLMTISKSVQHQENLVDVVKTLVTERVVPEEGPKTTFDIFDPPSSVALPVFQATPERGMEAQQEPETTQHDKGYDNNAGDEDNFTLSSSDEENIKGGTSIGRNQGIRSREKEDCSVSFSSFPPWQKRQVLPRDPALTHNLSKYFAKREKYMIMNDAASVTGTGTTLVDNVHSSLTPNRLTPSLKISSQRFEEQLPDPLLSFYELRAAYYCARQQIS